MIKEETANNKRIAKNTFFLYSRMLLLLLITLYTSRIVLAELGVIDYGIYNVVGSIVIMFSFINSSMSTSTQRFLTYELGRGNFARLKSIFAVSLNIHILIGFLIVFFAETIGLWFVNIHLVIPEDKIVAANIVYQCSILSAFLSITQVPYNASLIAHEEMNIYAYLSILEGVGKLIIVYLLLLCDSHKLVFYGILMMASQSIILFLYRLYCIRHYQECRFSLFWDRTLYKSLSSFAGWNLLGSIAWQLRGQGLSILLNLFFGPALNAAKGIADSVSNSVSGFVNSFNTAMNPQITKNYATNNIAYMEKLCYQGTKFSFLLLFVIALPVMTNIDYILRLWLVEVPDFTVEFIVLTLATCLIDSLLGASQMVTAMMATGKIRNYQIVVATIIISVLPISYIFLKFGAGPLTIFYVLMVICLFSDIARFLFCKRQIGFSLKRILNTVWIPSLIMVIMAVPLVLFIKKNLLSEDNIITLIANSMCSIVIVSICSWIVVMNRSEKKTCKAFIINKYKNIRNGKGV